MTWSKVHSSFWTGSTAESLGHDVDALHLAHYLVTGPMASITGLYHLAVPTACKHTGLTADKFHNAINMLKSCGFAHWDHENCIVYVNTCLRWQIIGDRNTLVSEGDKRVKSLVKSVDMFAWHPFASLLAKDLAIIGVDLPGSVKERLKPWQ